MARMAPLVAMAESDREVQKVVAHAIPTASSVLLMPWLGLGLGFGLGSGLGLGLA